MCWGDGLLQSEPDYRDSRYEPTGFLVDFLMHRLRPAIGDRDWR